MEGTSARYFLEIRVDVIFFKNQPQINSRSRTTRAINRVCNGKGKALKLRARRIHVNDLSDSVMRSLSVSNLVQELLLSVN